MNKPKTRKDKILFIMCHRYDDTQNNDTLYKYLLKEYSKTSDEELDIEVDFYFNLEKNL